MAIDPTLVIRWSTPRGRMARREVLDDLRHDEGANLREIVSDLRRPGVEVDALDLRGIDLHGRDLLAVRFAHADLRGANLEGA
ncbi:MAG: pentapeptide repeat-containing protein, partial [Myxococcales bacterium]|nr:pentapeptide repeat-containing protein [Myxococcales bacterium]